MSFEDIAPLNEVERLRIENVCCHEEIERQADRIEKLETNKSEQVLELEYHIDQQYAEIVRFQSRIKKLEAALREWESVMNKLSMRVGLTSQDIADVLNPIMDTTRTALEKKP